MPPKADGKATDGSYKTIKRKDPPHNPSISGNNAGNGRFKRVKIHDARTVLTQTADAALKNGELDIQSFLNSREFEIKALQNGMQKSKKALTQRAFQQVPRDMRRRTASHNVKRVPKRLQKRARREMKEDNTPTVTPNKRKPGGSRGRIRAETAKRLGVLAAQKRATKAKSTDIGNITTRAAKPKIRKNLLNEPPKPKSKFRKRQIHKTWLPTHMWHAKRARMTEPKNPLWRFSIPITCTEKSYRPTHRAGGTRGAVTCDTSYMSTIGLEGSPESLEGVLKAMGLGEEGTWGKKGQKWLSGKRSWNCWLSREVYGQRKQIAPAIVIWCPPKPLETIDDDPKRTSTRQLFIRIHPSAFLECWTEILRLSKLQRPVIHVQDLRFEIGSIEITGPGSTEALLGILHPLQATNGFQESHGEAFKALAGVTNPASLPSNSLLAFSITDPRLHYPPKPASIPKSLNEDVNSALLEMLSAWPVDNATPSSALFDQDARLKATRLPSQKSLNRRKGLALPGCYPSILSTDPSIPIMLLTSRLSPIASAQGTWTLLAPWKCILPIWYGLVHYPLSSGGNPRFGGLKEIRQIHFEQGVPWFPADYIGTGAGFAWEKEQRQRRRAEWERQPKGKRIEWSSLDLGAGRKGEIGLGWSCDFESQVLSPATEGVCSGGALKEISKTLEDQGLNHEILISHLPTKAFTSLLSSKTATVPPTSAIAVVRLTLVCRGVAKPCARIYRLPAPPSQLQDNNAATVSPQPSNGDSSLLKTQNFKTETELSTTRQNWVSLLPPQSKSKDPPDPRSRPVTRIPLDVPLPQRLRLLAQSLLVTPPLPYPAIKKDDMHPLVPDEKDLIGFVTTGEFNLAQGKGVAIGNIFVSRTMEALRREDRKETQHGRWCIVRNAGESVGRLARWDPVGS